jgi:hypothetical protein
MEDQIGDDRGGDNGEKDDDSRSQDSQKNESDDDDDDSLVLPPVSVSTEANLKEAVKNVSDDELKKIGIERAMEVQATTSATGTPVKPNLEIHGLGRDAIEHLSDDARKVLESLDIKPEAISTSNDLKLFISSKIAKNSKIEAVDTTETQTEVDYTSQAKVLGFIPVHMKSKIVLDANGNVVVKMPWYRGLVSKKWKDSIIEKYGSMQKFMETTWEKSIQTCTKKYGVPHLYYLEKFRNCYKPKTVVLPKTKRHVKCQGYEDIAIQTLCQDPDFDEGDLVVGDDCPAIPYVYMNKDAKYFPDIYLKSKRVLIEIKSMFTLHMQYERNLLKFKAADELYDFYIWVYDTATSQPKILRYADLANEHPPLCDDYIKTEIERPLTSHEKYLLENGEATTYEDKFIQSILQNGLFPAPTFVYCGAKKQCDIQCRYGHIFKKSWDMWKLDTKGCERCKQVDKYIVDRQAYINLCPKLGLSFTSMVQNIGKIGYSVTVECDNCKLTDVIASTALDRRTSQGCTTCCKHIKLPKLE